MRRCIASGIFLVIVTAGGCATVNTGGDESTSSPSATVTRDPTGNSPTTTSPRTTSPRTTSPRTTSPTLTSDASRQQASALDELLDRSAINRRAVATATGQINRCTNLSGAQRELSQAATNRQALVRDLNNMDLSALPGGETLGVDLEDAWDASALSDRSYASWAVEAQDAGCPPGGPAPRTSSHAAAQSTDQIATESKEAFVSLWNPIASDYGLTQRTAGSF